jgi:DNA-binding NtrC family response regulator
VTERVLVVDDDDALRESLELVLAEEGYEVTAAADGRRALERISAEPIDIVLCDVRMPGMDGMELLPELVRRLPNATVVMMSAFGSSDLAVEALRRGAYDYLAKPFQPSEILLTLRKACERERLRRANEMLQRDVDRVVGDRPIVAASAAMIAVLELVERASEFKASVLLEGEPGTGKEGLARAIHAQSPRRGAPFVGVDCSALPEADLEIELFGCGPRVAADGRPRRGLVVEAHGGTLFLDEIGALPRAVQPQLLRVLQDEEVRPLGESKACPVDVRFIAATARDLAAAAGRAEFDPDLLRRLSVVRMDVPPLRERREDIPLLADHFLERARTSLGKTLRAVDGETLDRLVAYTWPGNIRELENVIERAAIVARADRIMPGDLPVSVAAPRADVGESRDLSLKRARHEIEAELILEALRRTGGNRTHAAGLLGISHRALLYKIKEYGIRDRERDRPS